tara:strand:+ start:519 stop:1565 length:1047 start_codon:yes stop_codon:yes gene_type:complete
MAYTTIDDPSAYFQTALYTGNASDGLAITFDGNSDLQPDWVWIKPRSFSGFGVVTDTNRGLTKNIYPNSNDAEETNTNRIQSMNSDGFTINNDSDTINKDSQTFAAWSWKANGGTTSSNGSGSITSTVQANTTAGFSIATYTGNDTDGATFGHGLGAVPHFATIKKRSAGGNWMTYHSAMGADKAVFLDLTNAIESASFYQETPTSTLITLNDHGNVNGSGSPTYICYSFAPIQGFSKFGKYNGNNNADGPFVYTGFKPAFLILKNIDDGVDWYMFDNKRDTDNVVQNILHPNKTDAASDSAVCDFLSNGFKFRTADNAWNGASDNYIYAAWAESPFVSSKGVPTTAR